MHGIGPVSIHLDPVALADVRSRLTGLIDDLTALDDLGRRPSDAELGGHEITDAVTGFVDAWARERRRLADHLRDCVRYLDQAVEKYGQTEELLKRIAPQQATPAKGVSP